MQTSARMTRNHAEFRLRHDVGLPAGPRTRCAGPGRGHGYHSVPPARPGGDGLIARRRTPTSTHWGNYDVEVSDGAVVALHPVADDPDPSPIGAGMARAQNHAGRILRPAVRRGWLEGGGGAARGRDAFVEVEWDEALDLAARELARVKAEHGNASIYGGSYGWGSAGRFHHPQGLLHRFLNSTAATRRRSTATAARPWR